MRLEDMLTEFDPLCLRIARKKPARSSAKLVGSAGLIVVSACDAIMGVGWESKAR